MAALADSLNAQMKSMVEYAMPIVDKCFATVKEQYDLAVNAVDPVKEVVAPTTVGKL